MNIRVQTEVTVPEIFASVDEAAGSAVDKLLVLGTRVRLVCVPSDEVKMLAALASRLAARHWGVEL